MADVLTNIILGVWLVVLTFVIIITVIEFIKHDGR